MDRGLPLVIRFRLPGLFNGVGAEQIVKRVPTGHLLGEQVCLDELSQQGTCVVRGDAGETCRCRQGEVGSGGLRPIRTEIG